MQVSEQVGDAAIGEASVKHWMMAALIREGFRPEATVQISWSDPRGGPPVAECFEGVMFGWIKPAVCAADAAIASLAETESET